MNWYRIVFYSTIVIIVTVPILSGPALGVIDLTTTRLDGIGEGSATVDNVEVAETARFDRALSSDSYILNVPDARIHVAAIEGRPVVSYKVSIHEMGYSRETSHVLDTGDTGWVSLSLEQLTLAPDRIDRESYAGELVLTLRVNGTSETLYEGNVTVEVSE